MAARKRIDLTVETVPIEDLTPDPQNARKHSQRNLDAIAGSLRQFGQVKPIVTARGNDGQTIVIAGNGTVEAAKMLGWKDVAIVRVPSRWTHAQARAYALADNRTAELAEWDPEVLSVHLVELDSEGWDLAELGFETLSPEDLSDGTGDDDPERGSLLDAADVALDEPDHDTAAGQVWEIDGRHVLCVMDLFTGWPEYAVYLKPGTFFLPYPEPYATQSERASKSPLLLVQPDPYLAAQLLDKHVAVNGPESVKRK